MKRAAVCRVGIQSPKCSRAIVVLLHRLRRTPSLGTMYFQPRGRAKESSGSDKLSRHCRILRVLVEPKRQAPEPAAADDKLENSKLFPAARYILRATRCHQ